MMTAGELRDLNRRIGAPGRIAAVVLVFAVVASASSIGSLGGSLFAPSARKIKDRHVEVAEKLREDYAKTLAQHSAQFTGRSVFFIPSPPPPKPPPEGPKAEVKPPEPEKPQPPKSYGGPKILAMVNDEVWFEDGQKLKVGADGKDGLKVKELRAPWEIAVVWKEVEFAVPLFERDKVVYPPKDLPKPATPESGAAKEEAPKTDKPAETPSAEPKPEGPKPSEPKPEEPKPASPKPGEPLPEPPKPAEPKPAEPTSGEPKPPKPDGEAPKHEGLK